MDAARKAETRTARTVQVKNRAPAPIQITAEQILLEARDRAQQAQPPPPKRHITDIAELKEHQLRTRKEFEDRLRLNRTNLSVWLRYAKWEEGQNEIERARSIYERALDIDFKHVPLWIRYAEMEMRHKFINRARNVWDRAVTLLPRVEVLWYKYTYMEEVLGNIAGARLVFERWMTWEPEEQAWLSYAKLEIRAGEIDRARSIYERYLACHPSQTAYLRYAQWEWKGNKQRALARRLYERASVELRADELDEKLYEAFAKFEEACGEIERARIVFRFGLQALAPEGVEAGAQAAAAFGAQAAAAVAVAAAQGSQTAAGRKAAAYTKLYDAYTRFEKSRGDKGAVEEVVLDKRRAQYEELVRSNPLNYDAWLDYTRLEEVEGSDVAYAKALGELRSSGGSIGGAGTSSGSSAAASSSNASKDPIGTHSAVLAQASRVREVYERAVACVPPASSSPSDKKYWRRYVYLWLNYAAWEELLCPSGAKDEARPAQVYQAALSLIPHAKFTFAKLWLASAKYEVRRHNVAGARKLMGAALGQAFKPRLIKGYIALEAAMGEIERCRKLYEVWLTRQPASVAAWCAFVDLEKSIGELERSRSLLELAISQPALDAPEVVWKHYIDLEISSGDLARARGLYERLLERTQHVKVWLSYATFELSVAGDAQSARALFERGYGALKVASGKNSTEGDAGVREQRAVLVETWLEWERARLIEAQQRLQELEEAAGISSTAAGGSGASGSNVARAVRDSAEISLDDDDDEEEQDAGAGASGAAQDSATGASGSSSAVPVDPALLAAAREAVSAGQARVGKLEGMQPRRVRRRRPVYEDGTRGVPAPLGEASDASAVAQTSASGAALAGWEEYTEWLFPDDESKAPALKLLQLAQAWKAAGGKVSASALLGGASGSGAGAAAESLDNADDEEQDSAPFGGGLGGVGLPGARPVASAAVRSLLASAMEAAQASFSANGAGGDDEQDGAGAGAGAGAGSSAAGTKRPRYDDDEGEDQGAGAGASSRRARQRLGDDAGDDDRDYPLPGAVAAHARHMGQAYGSDDSGQPQSAYLEVAGARGEGDNDHARGMEVEREQEDEIRASAGAGHSGSGAAARGSSRRGEGVGSSGAGRPLDMHSEADSGWDADRDQ